MHPSVDPSLLTLRAARDLLGRRRKELARHGVRVSKLGSCCGAVLADEAAKQIVAFVLGVDPVERLCFPPRA